MRLHLPLALAMLLSIALAACDHTQDILVSPSEPPVVSVPAAAPAAAEPKGSAEVVGDKVLIGGKVAYGIAVNSYQATAAGLTPIVASGVLPATTVDRIENLNIQAHDLITTADTTLTYADRAAGLLRIIDQLKALRGAN